jgi:acetyltransferase
MNKTSDLSENSEMIKNYPFEAIENVELKDGSEVTIRPIRPEDAPLLQAGFSRLSPESIYLRFLETFNQLTDKQARDFSTVDYHKRMALVAEIIEDGQDSLIGVARYAIVEPGVAESAIVVIDEYQSLGLGTILLDRLVKYARTQGVRAFLATVHFTNARIMRFIKRSGFPMQKKMLEPGVWEIRVSIEAQG